MLIVAGVVPAIGGAVIHIFLSQWDWANVPFHSAVEGLGSFASLSLAVLLLTLRRFRKDHDHVVWISAALIGMGILDGFHAAAPLGVSFVWLHGIATLVGGFFFALVWLSRRIRSQLANNALLFGVAIGASLVGALSITFPGWLPAMVKQGEFTLMAKAINIVGGLLFLAAAAYFVNRYKDSRDFDELLFPSLCLLFGLAGLLFPISQLWSADWWFWHLLRLAAYFIALGYMFAKTIKERITHTGFWLAMLVLVIIGLLSYRTTTKFIETSNSVTRSHEVLGKLHEIQLHVTAAESEQRGYVITGETRYLKQYHLATTRSSKDIQKIRELVAAQADQLRRLSILESQIQEKFTWMDQKIEERKSKGFDTALQKTKTGTGLELLGKIRITISEIEKQEEVLLKHRAEDMKADAQRTITLFFVGSLMGFVLLLLVFYNLNREIAEHKKAEETLIESEKRIRDIMEFLPIGIAITTPEGEIKEVNSALLKIMGYNSKEEILKAGAIARYYHPKDRERFIELLGKEGMVKGFEAQFKHRDGTVFWGSITSTLHETKTGTQFINSFQDITERRQAEEKLRVASLYARSLIEASLDPLVTISPDGKITDVNEGTEQVTEVPRKKLIGSDFSDYFTEPEKAREGYQEVFSKGFVKDYPLAIRHKSGRITDVLYNATVYKNEAGEVQGVFAAARDITKRKQAEEALRLASAYNRSLIEASLDPLVTIGPDGKITDVNTATEEATGYSRDDLVGKDFSDYFTDPKKAKAGYEQVFKEGSVHDYELELLHRDGHATPVLYNATVYRDEKGKVIGVFAAARDITERKKVEEEVKELNEELKHHLVQLEAANKELEAFSYSVSHDLRAPLRGIDGFSQVLLEDYTGKLDEQGKDYLQRVRAATQRMAELIDALLTLSRITRSEMRHETVNISNLISEIAGELQKIEPDRQVEFVIAKGQEAEGDLRLLRVMLENLLSNSWKFSGKKEKTKIEFGVSKENGESVYFVCDNGVGFDMAYVDKLFGVFQRLHPMSEFPGTGVGLATVQRIIHRHGGRIWAEGQVGKGATFYFTLP